jgi:hypothetical protein
MKTTSKTGLDRRRAVDLDRRLAQLEKIVYRGRLNADLTDLGKAQRKSRSK